VLQALRHFDNEFDIIDVVLRQIAVAQVNAALVIRVIRCHVIGSNKIIDAFARPAHGRYDVVAWLHLGYIRPDGFHLAEALVADD